MHKRWRAMGLPPPVVVLDDHIYSGLAFGALPLELKCLRVYVVLLAQKGVPRRITVEVQGGNWVDDRRCVRTGRTWSNGRLYAVHSAELCGGDHGPAIGQA